VIDDHPYKNAVRSIIVWVQAAPSALLPCLDLALLLRGDIVVSAVD
jgi:hypothetical protein